MSAPLLTRAKIIWLLVVFGLLSPIIYGCWYDHYVAGIVVGETPSRDWPWQ